ncbi:hypothetical protein LXL04_023872 [Taraxacum kok-saghyz]
MTLQERLLDLIHVKDTTFLTLKIEILCSLSHHKLSVEDIRGQGYEGAASNMHGEWNGIQTLILKECPYTHYIHCFAHQLQLALVAASKYVTEVHTFFKTLNFIVNVVSSSSKRNDQSQAAQIAEISHLIETGKSCVVLDDIATEGTTDSQRGDAAYALIHALSFDFVIVMHIMKEIMGITDKLCQTLQQKSITIVNACPELIQKLRDEDGNCLWIKCRLQELNSKFNDHVTQLLCLSASLDQKKSFNVPDICALVRSHYPLDFTEHENDLLRLEFLRLELQHYELDVHNHPI